MEKITIAIDGYSSTGKSTIAKQLAKALGYVYIDSGAMYRAVTLYAIRKGYIGEGIVDAEALVRDLPQIRLGFAQDPSSDMGEIFLNGENVERQIRGLEVSRWVSPVAKIPEVREKLVAQQREMGKGDGVVMDGRDIGTVVFPKAQLKLFMSASPEKRAYRRYKELLDRGDKITYDEVLENVRNRDRIDSTRAHSPLRKAPDAIEFDNSDMGLEEQFERIYQFALRVINGETT